MRYVAAYLLAQMGGNHQPSVDDIKKILGSVGIDCEEERAKRVIEALKGKNVEELIEKGKAKLASVPSAAGVAVSAAAPVAAAGGGGAAPAKEEKKEEPKKEEKKESESDEDMGFGLFD